MIIDGTAIAKRMLTQLHLDVERLPSAPTVRVLWVGNDPATELFVRIKRRQAEQVGIELLVESFPEDVSTQALCEALSASVEDALVVQLPLPSHVDTDSVLAAIPQKKDADVLSPKAYASFLDEHDALLPPVVSAVRAVLIEGDFSVVGKSTVVVGAGRLVGDPVARWLKSEGAKVEVVTREQGALQQALSSAELIVSGAGVPHLIKENDITNGVALVDAGTSESGTALVGDIDPSCAEKSVLYTPVPGGIGPITVAALLQNIVEIAAR